MTAIDNVRDYWPHGMVNRHFHVIDDDITDTRLTQTFDMITCVSVLEHIKNHNLAIKNMFSLLNPGGHLLLTFPYSEHTYVYNVYDLRKPPGAHITYITQSYSRAQLEEWCVENSADIVDQEYWQCWNGDFWALDGRTIPPQRVARHEKHQLSCVLLRK